MLQNEITFEKIKKLGLTPEFLASIVGTSASTLRRAFRGGCSLPRDQQLALANAVDDLARLQNSVNPLPLKFADSRLFAEILASRRGQQNGK